MKKKILGSLVAAAIAAVAAVNINFNNEANFFRCYDLFSVELLPSKSTGE